VCVWVGGGGGGGEGMVYYRLEHHRLCLHTGNMFVSFHRIPGYNPLLDCMVISLSVKNCRKDLQILLQKTVKYLSWYVDDIVYIYVFKYMWKVCHWK